MVTKLHGAAGTGLERSCEATGSGWLRSRKLWDGVQAFDYRGVTEVSTPGKVVVLHPDETHDGRAGTPAGFGYRIVYVPPARIHEAARAILGRPCALPFAREPVTVSQTLAATIEAAFRLGPE